MLQDPPFALLDETSGIPSFSVPILFSIYILHIYGGVALDACILTG